MRPHELFSSVPGLSDSCRRDSSHTWESRSSSRCPGTKKCVRTKGISWNVHILLKVSCKYVKEVDTPLLFVAEEYDLEVGKRRTSSFSRIEGAFGIGTSAGPF